VVNELNICSLFDGMSSMQIALKVAGLTPMKYFASEIEKFPIKSTMTLFPNTIQIGDVRNVKGSDLGFIHILAGGSPCQSFSFAGKRKGMATKCDVEILTLDHYLELKSQNFEFEGQSYLFWEYMRILHELREINPDIKFLLENVVMGEKWQNILTKAIGINPIKINSALVSAQNRNRLYWTNIGSEPVGFFGDLECGIPQPKDKGILLKDVLETFETSNFETQEDFDAYMDKYFLSDKALNYINKPATGGYSDRLSFMNYEDKNKSTCLTANHHKGIPYNMVTVHNTIPRSSKTGKGVTGPLSRNNGKTYCLDTGNTNAIEIQCVAMRGRNPENPKSRVAGLKTEQQLEARNDGKTNCLTSVQKDNLLMLNNRQKANFKNGDEKANTFLSTSWKGSQANGMTLVIQQNTEVEVVGGDLDFDGNFRERPNGKSGTLRARARNDESCSQLAMINKTIRRLTPRECGRLQTVPEDILDIMLNCGISDTQLYKMFGNGWTIDVIAYMLSYYKIEKLQPK